MFHSLTRNNNRVLCRNYYIWQRRTEVAYKLSRRCSGQYKYNTQKNWTSLIMFTDSHHTRTIIIVRRFWLGNARAEMVHWWFPLLTLITKKSYLTPVVSCHSGCFAHSIYNINDRDNFPIHRHRCGVLHCYNLIELTLRVVCMSFFSLYIIFCCYLLSSFCMLAAFNNDTLCVGWR